MLIVMAVSNHYAHPNNLQVEQQRHVGRKTSLVRYDNIFRSLLSPSLSVYISENVIKYYLYLCIPMFLSPNHGYLNLLILEVK